MPIKHWLNRELGEMLNDLLTGACARQRGYFNQKTVASLLQEHRQGLRDNAHHLWVLLMFEIWHRAFIDREPAPKFLGAKDAGLRHPQAITAVRGVS